MYQDGIKKIFVHVHFVSFLKSAMYNNALSVHVCLTGQFCISLFSFHDQ